MQAIVKFLGVIIIVIHFGILLLFNMAHVAKGELQQFFMLGLNQVRYCSLLNSYTIWTGLLGGYGFYSPSVGNTYQIQFCSYEKESKKYYNSPALKRQAAKMRFQSYLDIASAFVNTENNKYDKEKQQAKASIAAACNYLSTRLSCDSLEAKLITKHINTLSQLSESKPNPPNHLALYRYVHIPKQQP